MIKPIKMLGTVSGEGGPLIIGDSLSIRSWDGFAGDDFSRACTIFDSDPLLQGAHILVGTYSAILWEMQGGGIAHVYDLGNGDLMLVRPWLKFPYSPDEMVRIAHVSPTSVLDLGTFRVSSGSIAVVWAAESGSCITDQDLIKTGSASGELSVPGSAFVTTTEHANYHVCHDYVAGIWGEARRCRLTGCSAE